MYPYPTNNYHVPQFPTFTPITNNIPEIQYVNSPESADAFNLPPNRTAVLFNQNADEFYIISTDASGSRTRNDFTFKPKAKDTRSQYVTRGELEDFKKEVLKKTPREVTKNE